MKNRMAFLCVFGLGLLTGLWARPLTDVAVAQEPPPRVTVTPTNPADVPPRPTLTPTSAPTPAPASTDSPDAAQESRAQIILVAGQENNGRWSVVQWLDGRGVWQNVEGWEGHIRQGQVRWRVLTPDFGKSPYRWTVLDKPDGALLCASEPFQLPVDWLDQVTVEIDDCTGIDSVQQLSQSPPPAGPAQNETIYVLRVRHSPDGSPQFTIHNIDTFETWFFSSFDNLRDFLAEDSAQ